MLPEEQFISLIAVDLHDQIKSLSSNDEFIKGIIKCLKEQSTEDSPVSADVNWGEVNWGPAPQWEQPLPPQDEPQAE